MISHPILKHHPPSLNSLLGEIAPNADQYYIHDLAILPEMRRQGHAVVAMERIMEVARRYETVCLVLVYGAASLWKVFGFVVGMAEHLRRYGEDAAYLERENPS